MPGNFKKPSRPITPDEVQKLKEKNIPEQVFDAFNDLIARSWDGKRAVVLQAEAATAIAERMSITREAVFARKLLDVEEAYRGAGWHVVYDKPGYNEPGEASFEFSRK